MRIITAALIFAASSEAVFRPYSVSYDALINSNLSSEEVNGFQQALADNGMVALTGMPNAMVKDQTACLLEKAGQVIQAEDGTTRYTLATETTPSGMQALFQEQDAGLSESCQIFRESSVLFRTTVHEAVKAFAKQVDDSFTFETPLLESSLDISLDSVSDIVEHGARLEHFHTYVKKSASDEPTLDWHVDQGLLLAFTPGRWEDGQVTDGFFLETSDGKVEEVDFEGASVVLMLGDGVNQYINPKMLQEGSGLRAVPHALRVPASELARDWYGLMVLPPPNAMHPVTSNNFGALREGLIAGQSDALALGCAGDEHFVTVISGRRILHDGEDHGEEDGGAHVVIKFNETHDEHGCELATQAYCWHRCMTIPDEALACGDGQHMKCINPRSQLWKGKSHGDYFPACIDVDAPVETDFPKLPNYPRNEDECSDFDSFVSAKTSDYSYQVDLPDGDGAVFQWNVVENGTAVEGRLAFNGIFGYLSIGFVGYGGRNKMYNAPVIMALPASEYDPTSNGFNFSTPAMVDEYITSGKATTFRGWSTPYTSEERRRLENGNVYSVDSTDCFTELLFTAHTIAGKEFTLDGTDELIWAANNVDKFAQYHGKNRGVFNVTWTSDEFATTSAASSVTSGPVVALGMMILAMMTAL